MINGAASGQRLLVTADEFHASLALVRGLRAGGYVPIVAVSRPDTYSARSRAAEIVVRVPSEENEPDRFAPSIADLARRHGVAAVLPGSEPALIALSRHRAAFDVPLGAPEPEVVDLATDKNRVLEIAADYGLVPPHSIVGTPSALRVQSEALAFPAILKPSRSRVETDDRRLALFEATRIENPQELRRALEGLPEVDWVVQPFIGGGLCAVAGVAWEGRLICAVHQVSPRIWPSDVGFSCYARTVPPDPALDARLARVLERTRWSGLFQLQMLRGEEGQPLVIDFNPRAYGSLALAIGAGANLPAIWAALLLGDHPPSGDYRPGVHYRLETADVRAIIALARERRLREAIEAIRPRHDTVHPIFQLRDPRPAVVAAQRLLAKVAR